MKNTCFGCKANNGIGCILGFSTKKVAVNLHGSRIKLKQPIGSTDCKVSTSRQLAEAQDRLAEIRAL